MVTIVKHEWHQVDEQYAFELDEELLSEIYPDLDVGEIVSLMVRIQNGEVSVDEIVDDAYNNDVEIEWDHQYSDCWTSRKGGYDVTYELGDEDSWHHEPPPPEPTHKCTNCKWTGQSYDAEWCWTDKEGNELEDPLKICPYCESPTELTEAGIQKEKEREERLKRWKEQSEEREVPCYSCDAMHKESELPELEGQLYCPDCQEGWIMMENREGPPWPQPDEDEK